MKNKRDRAEQDHNVAVLQGKTVEGMQVVPVEYRYPQAQCEAGRQLHHLSKALTEETQSRENLMKMGHELLKLGSQLIRLGE